MLGLPIGFASSLCGIGGGLFAGSLLHFGLGFSLKRSAATALVLVFATAMLGALVHTVLNLHPIPRIAGIVIGATVSWLLVRRLYGLRVASARRAR